MEVYEESEVVVDFGEICRLCLSDGDLIPLYPKVGNNNMCNMIFRLTTIMIVENDVYPLWICRKCSYEVSKSLEFIEMCGRSQQALSESYFQALSDAGLDIDSHNDKDAEPPHDKLEEVIDTVLMKKETDLINIAEVKQEMEVDYPVGTMGPQDYCRDCCQEFSTSQSLMIHRINVHHDDLSCLPYDKTDSKKESPNSWTCHQCGEVFASRNDIKLHLKKNHTKIYKEPKVSLCLQSMSSALCQYCGSKCGSHNNLISHFADKHKVSELKLTGLAGTGSYDCHICYRPFLRPLSLMNHMENKHSEIMRDESYVTAWSCNKCSVLLSLKDVMKQHCYVKHRSEDVLLTKVQIQKSRNMFCGHDCGYIGKHNLDIIVHKALHHEENLSTLDCPACSIVLATSDELRNHFTDYHLFLISSLDNTCLSCRLEFNSHEDLLAHIALHDRTQKDELKMGKSECQKHSSVSHEFVCDVCGMGFENAENHLSHQGTCGIEGWHPCHICGKSFKSEFFLKRHCDQLHSKIFKVQCPACPKTFRKKLNMHRHYKNKHLKGPNQYVCSFCGLTLKGPLALTNHENGAHRNLRPYKCTECPEAFTTLHILKKHTQRHLSDEERVMHQCLQCDKQFTTYSGLERHVLTHGGIKSHVCELPMCQKAFYTKNELRRHTKYHNKDYNNICTVCDQKFITPGELKKHGTKHTGERPFKCHVCSNVYARRDDKLKHLRRVHNLKVKKSYGRRLQTFDEPEEYNDTVILDES